MGDLGSIIQGSQGTYSSSDNSSSTVLQLRYDIPVLQTVPVALLDRLLVGVGILVVLQENNKPKPNAKTINHHHHSIDHGPQGLAVMVWLRACVSLMLMASTSSKPSHPNNTRFHVFLNFRGVDSRHSFTDHLDAALNRAGIHSFRDDDEIRRGRVLKPEIGKAIETSRASIVVLSENYAKSRWCLEELWLILQQKRKGNHFVLPVFYHVDPSDVRNQRKGFAMEANEGIEGSNWTEVDMNRWKSALTEVANLTGMVASGSETEFIAKIVFTIQYELDLKLVSTPAHLTGMETRAKQISSWLKNEHSCINVLAICGMGGSGKTTLAQYIYNSNKQNFESSCFLEEIGEHSKQTSGLLGLQKQVLIDILGGKNEMISCVAEATNKINEVLQMKNVLIVLDDIDEHDKLGALLGTNVIHTQSKIIITTRLLDIQSWFAPISWRCHVHELQLLNGHESLEILSWHAFGSQLPPKGFNELAVELAQYCGGNPLALKVLGSSLYVSVEDPRERNSIIEIWRSRLNSLSSSKGDLDFKIQGVLQKSFDSLPLSCYKELFLHIVIFFVGEDEDYVVKILEQDWHAKAGIMTLINRCLLTISPNKKLMVHQLLQDMGRNIVREESKDPSRCKRVWSSDEAYRVLTKGDGLEIIEGLTLDTRKLKKETKAFAIETSSLEKMLNLKLLQLKYVKLSGHYKNIPELRWLCWHGCHLRTIPSVIMTSNFLVAIDLTRGNLEMFEPPAVLHSLKIVNLKSCHKLVSIRSLYRLPNLVTLILWWCLNLTHICKTIGELENLALLNLAGCQKLWKSSSNKMLLNQQERLKALCVGGAITQQPLYFLPRSLKFLFFDHCNLEYHNDLRVIYNGQLLGLSLRGNKFEFMPNNIDFKMLRILNLNYCINLKSISCLPNTLEELYTYQCKSLEKVTFETEHFSLQKFEYRGCFKLCEVQGLFKLVAIKELDEADLGHMKWIKAYQDHKVDLVGDEITMGRIWHIQMLYQYGIRSTTYMQDINDQSMITSEYTSGNEFLYFRVSLHPKRHMIQGLNVSCLYRSSGCKYEDWWPLFGMISNVTKGITWIYNPLVYCKPRVDEDAMWLSYWPIGNFLDVGDVIEVHIIVGKEMMVSKCGVSLVYINDGEVQQEEKWEFETKTRGVHYLGHCDFFKLVAFELLQGCYLGHCDTTPYNQLHRWRKSYQPWNLDASFMHLKYSVEAHRDTVYKGIWLGLFNSKSDIPKIKNVVSMLVGVEDVYYFIQVRQLYVLGCVDSKAVETCVREYDKTIKLLMVNYNAKRIRKRYHMNNVMWGPNFITS
ncbi:hypothetical protein SSX86_007584 [Deinandra increscens subsp. villosa]|uniref:TIR domain-containing protein n=1 Tax=Deinandra increscens subsp. villosa TaxID=3103831 RepID=A0AAP0H829_9ASTR